MKPTSRDDEVGRIFELLVTNIEHDGSYIPVSAIRNKFPEVESALNLYINQELIRLIGVDEEPDTMGNVGVMVIYQGRNQLRHQLRQSVNNRGAK